MSLLKFVLYSLIAYLVIRFVMRFLYPPKPRETETNRQADPQPKSGMEGLEKPKFTIEAESVDYEIVKENPKKENHQN